MKRREFLVAGTSLCASNVFGFDFLDAFNKNSTEKHFFLQVVFKGGWDPTYLFDGRSLDLHKAGLQNNYLNQGGVKRNGDNGNSTLISPLANNLFDSYRKYFSVFNGVHMFPSFDGHTQNMEYLFTGNPFGGDSFLPLLNQRNLPLDVIQTSGPGIRPKNRDKSITLEANQFNTLIDSVHSSMGTETEDSILDALKEVYQFNAKGKGAFSKANQELLNSINSQGKLIAPIKKLNKINLKEENLKQRLSMIKEAFINGLCRGACITIKDYQLDTHAPSQAKEQVKIYSSVVNDIKIILEFLIQEKLMDSTTFCIGSEFSRTMRQNGKNINATGTDHNPLSNTFLVGGKGIQKSQIFGESDNKNKGEKLSQAHKQFDKKSNKAMGKVFDFKSLKTINQLPEKYEDGDYLSFSSLVNTFYKQFGVPQSQYRVYNERDKVLVPNLQGILI